MHTREFRKKRGFTLVEVALAVVVVAIGIMAAFALIGTGLDSSARAVADTRASLFADDIFNGLRSQSVLALDLGGGAWEKFWTEFAAGHRVIDVSCGPFWPMTKASGWGAIPEPISIASGGPHAVAFTNFSFRTDELTDFVNHAVRYSMRVRLNTETITDDAGKELWKWTNKVSVVLNVWEGQFGKTELDRALTFTSEFKNSGGL